MKCPCLKWASGSPILCLILLLGCDFDNLPHARLTDYDLSPSLVESVFDVQVLREIGNLEDFLKKIERLGMPIYQGNQPPEIYTFEGNTRVGARFIVSNECFYDEKNPANVKDMFGRYEQGLLIERGGQGEYSSRINYRSIEGPNFPEFPSGLDTGEGLGYVTGSGQDFTIFTKVENGDFDGVPYKALWLISGTLEDNDGFYTLKNVFSCLVMLDKGGDPDDKVANIGTVRLFRDASPEWIQSEVSVTQISPLQGSYDTELTILGSGFSPVPANNTVWVNESIAQVREASHSRLLVIIPKGAGTGNIRVEVLEKSGVGGLFTYIPIYTVFTVAGNGIGGRVDGVGDMASFQGPTALALDQQNNLFVTDTGNGLIRFVSWDGEVKALSSTEEFNEPFGICSDGENGVWVTDRAYHMVARIFSDHSIEFAYEVYGPTGIAKGIDNSLYLSIPGQYSEVLRVFHNGEFEEWSTIGAETQFFDPWVLCVSPEGNIYVAEAGNTQVRMITPSEEVVELIPVNQLSGPRGIILDAEGNVIVADTGNHQIKKISPSGEISILAGNGDKGHVNGPGAQASFNFPYGLAINEEGVIFVADSANHSIRKLVLE